MITNAEFNNENSYSSDVDKDTLNSEDFDDGDDNVILVSIENDDDGFDFTDK